MEPNPVPPAVRRRAAPRAQQVPGAHLDLLTAGQRRYLLIRVSPPTIQRAPAPATGHQYIHVAGDLDVCTLADHLWWWSKSSLVAAKADRVLIDDHADDWDAIDLHTTDEEIYDFIVEKWKIDRSGALGRIWQTDKYLQQRIMEAFYNVLVVRAATLYGGQEIARQHIVDIPGSVIQYMEAVAHKFDPCAGVKLETYLSYLARPGSIPTEEARIFGISKREARKFRTEPHGSPEDFIDDASAETATDPAGRAAERDEVRRLVFRLIDRDDPDEVLAVRTAMADAPVPSGMEGRLKKAMGRIRKRARNTGRPHPP